MILRIPQAEADAILKPWTDQLTPIDAELKRLDDERKAFNAKGNPEVRTLMQVQAEIKELKARRLPIAMSMPVLDKAYAVAEGSRTTRMSWCEAIRRIWARRFRAVFRRFWAVRNWRKERRGAGGSSLRIGSRTRRTRLPRA